jgi:hypothetical protein
MKMKKNNAGQKLVIIIAALCIFVYTAALVQSIIRFYLSVEKRKITAETEFSNIADLASSAGVLGFMDEPFKETINEALMLSKSIEALIISGPDGEYAFERQKDRAISWVNNSPRFKNRFDFSGVSLYQPLRIHGLRNVNIQAVANAFDYAAITKILKETLFLILFGFILAFFTFLIQLLLDKPENEDSSESAAAANPVYDKPAAAVVKPFDAADKPAVVTVKPVADTYAPDKPSAPVNKPVSSADKPVPAPDSNNYEIPRTYENKNLDELSEAIANTQINDIDIDDAKTDDIEANSIEIDDFSNIDEINTDELKTDDIELKLNDNEITVPKGLYSQRSNIGWEEHTMDRLDSELHRCASTEEDLVIIVLEFTHGLSDNQFAVAADEAVGFFTSRDLVFENGKHGITIIYPGVDLETGILRSQVFQRRINDKFKLGNEIRIGLSSRAGRLINAGRILMEAMEALQKAKADPSSSIIAFKSDPEKYRAFLSRQASG